jgi:glycosyltransferase involved in cell wall biosynthesis
MEAPWVSVIIPSHNGERWLATALQSLAVQAESEIEVLVVDGSDHDASLEIARTFCARLNLRLYRRQDLRSWTAKTNFGVAEARADHICMLHQDDLWLPRRSAEIRKWIGAHPNGVLHVHPVYVIDEAGREQGLWRCPLPGDETPVGEHMLMNRLLVQNFIAIPSPVIRRDAFLRVGGLDDQLWYTADWDLYLKLAAQGNVYYHPTALACFRVHRGSLTFSGSRHVADFRRQMEIVLDRHAGRLGTEARGSVLRVARTSIAVNAALAAANRGNRTDLFKAIPALMRLGPVGLLRYVRDSRIVERVYPRLRARLAGGF